MTSLTDLSLLEAASALRKGDVSSKDLMRACMDRIEKIEPEVHAFLALTPKLATEQAEKADLKIKAWRKTKDEPLPTHNGNSNCSEGCPLHERHPNNLWLENSRRFPPALHCKPAFSD